MAASFRMGIVLAAAWAFAMLPGVPTFARAANSLEQPAAGQSSAAGQAAPNRPGPDSSQQGQAPKPALSTTVRRVIVDVVVTDKGGHPVRGLQAQDFHIFEDGREQTVRSFDVHATDRNASALPAPPTLPPHTFMNYPVAPKNAPLTVVLYDVVNTPIASQSFAHAALVKFLKDSPLRNETAIFVLSDHLHLLQGFTSDRGALLDAVNSKGGAARSSTDLQETGEVEQNSQAVDNITPNSQNASQSATEAAQIAAQGSSAGQMDIVQALTNIESLESAALLDRRVDLTLEALEEIARFLAGTPGRKNLIWLSGSFPISNMTPDLSSSGATEAMRIYIDRIVETNDLLNANQVAVYPLDVRGLRVNPMYQASSARTFAPTGGRRGTMPPDAKAVEDFANSQTAEQATMDQIGDQTGGRGFYNTNGLDQAIATALDDGNNYYSLTYGPTNTKYDGSLRHIRVSLDRSGDQLAYRQSYFADDLDTGRNPSAEPVTERLESSSFASAMQFGTPSSHQLLFVAHLEAVGEPAPATEKQMQDLMPYLEAASRNGGKKFAPPQTPVALQQYAVYYAVLAKQLDLATGEDNISRPKLTFAELAFDSDGQTLTGLQATIEDAIPAARLAAVQRDGYRIVQSVFVPVNASVLRLGVRDGRTNRMGSLEIRLPLSPSPEHR